MLEKNSLADCSVEKSATLLLHSGKITSSFKELLIIKYKLNMWLNQK
jgi:hypothetical protein